MKYKKNMESEFKNRSAEWVKSEMFSITTSYGEIRERPTAVKKRYLQQRGGTKAVTEELNKVNQIENIEENEDNLNYLRLFVSCLILGIISLSLGITFLCLDILFKWALVITIIGSILPLIYVISVFVIAKALQEVIREEKYLVQLEKSWLQKGFSFSDDIIPVIETEVSVPTRKDLNYNENVSTKKVDTNEKKEEDARAKARKIAEAEFDRKIDAEIKGLIDERLSKIKTPKQNNQPTNNNFDSDINDDDDDLKDRSKVVIEDTFKKYGLNRNQID